MKKALLLTLAISLSATIGLAQAAPDAAPPVLGQSAKAPNSDPLSGAILEVELSKSLDTKKSKAEDKIEARTATDLLQHGQIVVPRNTKIVGHITEAKAHSKSSPGSTVGITFDRMLLKDGREVPLNVTVQAIGRPLSSWISPGGYGADNTTAPTGMSGQRSPMGTASNTPSAGAQYPGASDPLAPGDPRDSSTSTPTPLNPTSRGVVGIKGLSMDTAGQVSKLNSTTGNVHLDGGTQLILRVM